MRFLTTLDRYLIRNYLTTFLFVLGIFTLISMAIDFSDKVQSFIEKPCTLKNIVLDYYAGWIFHMASLILPVYTLVAVVFFTSRLAFNSEILSILNAGVSFQRMLRPYLVAAGVVAASHLIFNHFLVPKLNKSRLWFEHTFVWTDQEKGRTSNVHLFTGPDTKVFIRGYNKTNQTANGLRLEHMQGTHVKSILEADQATWQDSLGKWHMPGYTVRQFDGLREKYVRYTTPLDTMINLAPQDFIFYENQNQELTTPELFEAIRRDRSRGLANSRSYEIEVHRRSADAVTNIILTVIGLAVAGRKVRGGMGLHLTLGIGIGAMFILLSKFAVSFATSGTVPVGLGMWIPNIVFLGVALWLVKGAQK